MRTQLKAGIFVAVLATGLLASMGQVKMLPGLTAVSGGSLVFRGVGSKITEASDGVLTLLDAAGTSFSRLQFGGTTSSFPSLARSTTEIRVRLADDSAYASLTAGAFRMAAGTFQLGSSTVLMSTVAPTISSGFGTTPTIPNSNGTAAFTVNVGTGGTATTGVIGLPAATTGWNCFVNDLTAAAAHVAYDTRQTASTTTTATLENQTTSTGAAVAWAASDILRVSCFAY